MTTTVDGTPQRRAGKGRAAAPAFVLTRPQVNLLPPEVRSARSLSRVKKWLAAVLVLALVLAAGVVGLAVLAQSAADLELAEARDETETLLTEQAKYAEVPQVLGELRRVATAQEAGMSTEVLWRSYFSAIAATAPSGLSIETLNVVGATPMALPAAPTDALAAPSVATVTFTARSLTLPDTAAWITSLRTVPGFADPWFTSATLTDDDGVTQYTVSATVQVNEQAYARRFVQTGEES